jgi:3-deoxy-manno-octulosonate cytidylyltransferase (CMP-KDO synthetase)
MGTQPEIVAIIPARYAATRLPGKPLLDLAGQPIIQHVYQRTAQAQMIQRVFVATDDERIAEVVRAFGGEVVMTSPRHETGTDRLAEAVGGLSAEIIVNVQGDEPFIEPATIEAAVQPLIDDPSLMMSTISEPIRNAADLFNPNVVKVVVNRVGDALYFSRAPIPFPRAIAGAPPIIDPAVMLAQFSPADLRGFYKHVGLYVYRRNFLLEFTGWPRASLEQLESLEQLRVLENGYRIRVVSIEQSSIGIDTPEDLARARRVLAKN